MSEEPPVSGFQIIFTASGTVSDGPPVASTEPEHLEEQS